MSPRPRHQQLQTLALPSVRLALHTLPVREGWPSCTWQDIGPSVEPAFVDIPCGSPAFPHTPQSTPYPHSAGPAPMCHRVAVEEQHAEPCSQICLIEFHPPHSSGHSPEAGQQAAPAGEGAGDQGLSKQEPALAWALSPACASCMASCRLCTFLSPWVSPPEYGHNQTLLPEQRGAGQSWWSGVQHPKAWQPLSLGKACVCLSSSGLPALASPHPPPAPVSTFSLGGEPVSGPGAGHRGGDHGKLTPVTLPASTALSLCSSTPEASVWVSEVAGGLSWHLFVVYSASVCERTSPRLTPFQGLEIEPWKAELSGKAELSQVLADT